MLNRKLKRLAVSPNQMPKTISKLTTKKVSIDEIREHSREMADGYVCLFHASDYHLHGTASSTIL